MSRAVASAEQRFHDSYVAIPETGCWIWTKTWTYLNQKRVSYGSLHVGEHINTYRQMPAHRYSYFLHTGKMPTKDQHVMHKCDVGVCVNPEHLMLGTHAENMADMANKNRVVAPVKLSGEQAQEARKLRESGMTVRSIATIYGMSESHMSRILRYNYRKIERLAETSNSGEGDCNDCT